MQKAIRVLWVSAAIALTLYVAWGVPHLFMVEWSYGHLEQNARKVATAAELQSWATNVIAANPRATYLVKTNLGPGFPKRLLTICPHLGPSVSVIGSFESPWVEIPWVQMTWSSGMRGAEGFEIGPTNFTGFSPNSHQWAPGVYFYAR